MRIIDGRQIWPSMRAFHFNVTAADSSKGSTPATQACAITVTPQMNFTLADIDQRRADIGIDDSLRRRCGRHLKHRDYRHERLTHPIDRDLTDDSR
jgi:hypothetical protein